MKATVIAGSILLFIVGVMSWSVWPSETPTSPTEATAEPPMPATEQPVDQPRPFAEKPTARVFVATYSAEETKLQPKDLPEDAPTVKPKPKPKPKPGRDEVDKPTLNQTAAPPNEVGSEPPISGPPGGYPSPTEVKLEKPAPPQPLDLTGVWDVRLEGGGWACVWDLRPAEQGGYRDARGLAVKETGGRLAATSTTQQGYYTVEQLAPGRLRLTEDRTGNRLTADRR